MKLRLLIFEIKSFLPPSLVFYPPILRLRVLYVFEILIFLVFVSLSDEQRGGKKLVRGEKSFDLQNINLQLHFAEKISKKSLELAKIAKNEICSFLQ